MVGWLDRRIGGRFGAGGKGWGRGGKRGRPGGRGRGRGGGGGGITPDWEQILNRYGNWTQLNGTFTTGQDRPRHLLLSVGWSRVGTTGEITAVTLGGVSATRLYRQETGYTTHNVEIFYAEVSSGTSAAYSVSFSNGGGAYQKAVFQVYAHYNADIASVSHKSTWGGGTLNPYATYTPGDLVMLTGSANGHGASVGPWISTDGGTVYASTHDFNIAGSEGMGAYASEPDKTWDNTSNTAFLRQLSTLVPAI